MSLTPSPLARWGRMALALLAVAVFFGPPLAAFATSPAVVPVPPTQPRVPVIHAQPFLTLASDTCFDDGPLHIGPVQKTKGLFYEAGLRDRLTETARRCLPSSGYLTVSASVDRKGNLSEVAADSGADRVPAECALSFIRSAGPVETRGPGRMKIGFFVGRTL